VINLLPPDIKEQIRYSRRNRLLRNYLIMSVSVTAVLAGALLGGRLYLNQQVSDAQSRIADKNLQIASYKKVEDDAKKINARLSAIQSIQKSQTKFSVLLDDLAQNLPQGSSISSLTLTGDEQKPVRMMVNAVDYGTATSVRDSITKSKRISAADIESIQGPDNQKTKYYQVTVSFAFNPGATR
jgi:Tfp pilus assembly protein PilN